MVQLAKRRTLAAGTPAPIRVWLRHRSGHPGGPHQTGTMSVGACSLSHMLQGTERENVESDIEAAQYINCGCCNCCVHNDRNEDVLRANCPCMGARSQRKCDYAYVYGTVEVFWQQHVKKKKKILECSPQFYKLHYV